MIWGILILVRGLYTLDPFIIGMAFFRAATPLGGPIVGLVAYTNRSRTLARIYKAWIIVEMVLLALMFVLFIHIIVTVPDGFSLVILPLVSTIIISIVCCYALGGANDMKDGIFDLQINVQPGEVKETI